MRDKDLCEWVNPDKHSCEYTLDGLASALLCHWIYLGESRSLQTWLDLGPLMAGVPSCSGPAI
jgi:hypothetical protein